MIGIDGNDRDGGVEKRRYSSNLFSFFSLFLSLFFFLSFFLPFSLPFSFSLLFCFCNILQNFQKSLYEIRIWRSCFVEV